MIYSDLNELNIKTTYLEMIKVKKEILTNTIHKTKFQTETFFCGERVNVKPIFYSHQMSTGTIYSTTKNLKS